MVNFQVSTGFAGSLFIGIFQKRKKAGMVQSTPSLSNYSDCALKNWVGDHESAAIYSELVDATELQLIQTRQDGGCRLKTPPS